VSRFGLLAIRRMFRCTAEGTTVGNAMRVLARDSSGWQLVEVGWAFLWRHEPCGVMWDACDPNMVPPENCAQCFATPRAANTRGTPS
jgi:hypothetical protein